MPLGRGSETVLASTEYRPQVGGILLDMHGTRSTFLFHDLGDHLIIAGGLVVGDSEEEEEEVRDEEEDAEDEDNGYSE